MPSKKIVYECKYCRKEFTDYDDGGMVMGMPLKNYENLMEEAANRLGKRE